MRSSIDESLSGTTRVTPRPDEDFRLLVATVRDYAIFMLDTGGFIVSWNAGAQRLKGYTEQDILGRHFSIFYSKEDVASRKPQVELEIAVRDGRVEDEGLRYRKDGTRFWANVVITALYDASGAHRGFAKVTRDLTERRRADEERVRHAQTQEALRLRDEFLSIASHELRTPLNVLTLSLQTIELTLPQELTAVRGRLDKAQAQLARLAELVNRLFDVTRISEGKMLLTLGSTDLSAVLKEAVDGCLAGANKAGSEIRLMMPDELEAEIDRIRVHQLVTNVVDNAIKYGRGGPIHVELARAGRFAIIRVRDEGIGIAADRLGRIFDRFEQAVPDRAGGGLGLGLYIAKQIADAHAGTITVNSTPNEGSTFEIALPLTRTQ
jgi:PAS domain S-box-containing protein